MTADKSSPESLPRSPSEKDPFASAYTRAPVASGGGGGGSGAGARNTREASNFERRDGYIAPDEVRPASAEPERSRRSREATEHERKVDLANRLAAEWSVNGARTVVDELGADFLEPFLDYLNEARALGEFADLEPIRNPGGFFVRKAYRKFNLDNSRGRGRKGDE